MVPGKCQMVTTDRMVSHGARRVSYLNELHLFYMFIIFVYVSRGISSISLKDILIYECWRFTRVV